MDVCRVVGNVVSTNKNTGLVGLSMLLVNSLDIGTMQVKGKPVVAIDTVGAGIGETVLLVSGSSARLTDVTKDKPVDAVIVGIIDSIELEGILVFNTLS